jgi:putative endonuclease
MTRKFGQECELAAADHYKKRGARILSRNYRCKIGEIDLIVVEKRTLVFVEVRGRQSNEAAIFSVDRKKQMRLSRVAAWFLAAEERQIPADLAEIRFDVVTVTGQGAVTRIPHAFFL